MYTLESAIGSQTMQLFEKKRIHCQQTKFTLYTRNAQHDFEESTYHFCQFNKNESSHI